MSFLKRFTELRRQKGSIMCISLDVRREGESRKEYVEKLKRLVERTAPYAVAFKVNENYTRHLSLEDHQEITQICRSLGALVIYDCKLSDITSTVTTGIGIIKDMGYDGLTINPIFGNLRQIVEVAHDLGLAVFSVTLPSNPESVRLFKLNVSGKKLFEIFAEDVKASRADGLVVSATETASAEDIITIRSVVGEGPIMLFPGIGAQGGDLEKAITHGGWNVLINVGRSIVESPEPEKVAADYRNALTDSWIRLNAALEIIRTPGVYRYSPDKPFILSSGKESDYYVDIRALYSHPDPRDKIAELMLVKISMEGNTNVDKVATTETAGIPIASIVAYRLGKGLVYVRHKEKSYGTGRKVEGLVQHGDKVICVDDLTTTGETAEACVKAVSELGGNVLAYYVVFDREEGATERLNNVGVRLRYLTSISTLKSLMKKTT
ncbi:MAG: orotate phosphoribosyltransferase [Nitrososphaerota archaeon]|nr:orotate phosphoribosyltransferase [Aigarchaeota archaeon]MDW8076385.1 orotate phosphoribosyltransferase [Nitrososphaerota archaeon]